MMVFRLAALCVSITEVANYHFSSRVPNLANMQLSSMACPSVAHQLMFGPKEKVEQIYQRVCNTTQFH